MASVRSKSAIALGNPKIRQKVTLPKENRVSLLHSNTMIVAPGLHLKFRSKVGIMYWIKGDEFFSENTSALRQKRIFWT